MIRDPEFDKRQEEFDKMIERQPLAVREHDFEYQVKFPIIKKNNKIIPIQFDLVSSFNSLRTSSLFISLSKTTLVYRST